MVPALLSPYKMGRVVFNLSTSEDATLPSDWPPGTQDVTDRRGWN
ncbi:unnamed protein product [Gulo gulo]|uniref:Uncharacterized protein n=1 Tax=Gulo gulo TaxID=48420 RepID=A0A9X9M1K3_GULGU|nr:unnamed protein product [Gulo gulo]